MAPLKLADGADLGVELLRRPVAPADELRVTDLLAAEWERSDVDWVPSLRGAYAATLTSVTAIGRCGAVDVGTATVSYPAAEPEIAVVENVTTLAEHRRRGIAAALTETVVQLAFDAGCRLCFLGNGGRVGQEAVYDRIGFARTGAIMRRAAPGFEAYERTLYAAGQRVSVRPACWGDLPGVAALVAQPLSTRVLDYQRGIGSAAAVAPTRCVSAFTTIHYDTQSRGGVMRVLAGAGASRVLGFGTAAPGPAPLRSATAVVDVVTHDAYADSAGDLLGALTEDGRRLGAARAVAFVAEPDAAKRKRFLAAGYRPAGALPRDLTLGGEPADVTLLEHTYG